MHYSTWYCRYSISLYLLANVDAIRAIAKFDTPFEQSEEFPRTPILLNRVLSRSI